MATKFRSPRRWDDYQINKALCFVVLAVFACVILLGFASASLTSYFTQKNFNRFGHVDAYSDSVGSPTLDVDAEFVDPYNYNSTITTTVKTNDYDKFIYLRFEVQYSRLVLDTNYAKLKIPKDGTYCVLNSDDSWIPIDQLPTCTLDDALMWSSCDTSNCPSNFTWTITYGWGTHYTYFFIYPRQPLDDEINIEFQYIGNFDTVHSESSVNFALFTSYLFVALALVIPFVLLVAAIVVKKLRKPLPVDEPDDESNVDYQNSNNNDVDEISGEELATFSSRIN